MSDKNYKLFLAGVISESQYLDLMEASIKAKDPVRNAVASLQTYWPKPGLALSKLQEILHSYGYQLADVPSFSVHDRVESHTQNFNLEKMKNPADPMSGGERVNNVLVFSWYWTMPGNKVEITTYIS